MPQPLSQFIGLIDKHLPEIIHRESDNSHHIYLYKAGTWWMAFEQSAFRLCRTGLRPQLLPLRTRGGHRSPVVMACLPEDDLGLIVRRLGTSQHRTVHTRVYEVEGETSPALYRHWHDLHTRELVACD